MQESFIVLDKHKIILSSRYTEGTYSKPGQIIYKASVLLYPNETRVSMDFGPMPGLIEKTKVPAGPTFEYESEISFIDAINGLTALLNVQEAVLKLESTIKKFRMETKLDA